jgi:cold shock CspA family protein
MGDKMLTGVIKNVPRFKTDKKPRFFGFIQYDGQSYFFHTSQLTNGLDDWNVIVAQVEKKRECKVQFEIDEPGDKGELRAKNVTLIK